MVALLPGGAYDAGIDAGWRTYVKMLDQEVEVEDREPITVKAGSTLSIFRLNDGRTYSAGNGPVIETCSDDITEIDAPVAPGETVYFKWRIYVSGSPGENYAVCIHTPTNPTGGFHVNGRSTSGTFQGGAFGADSFNTTAGVFAGGLEPTLASVNVVTVAGMLGNGYQPGRLVLQIGPAAEVNSQTFVKWQINVVMGTLPVLAPGESIALTFGLNEKTYTFNASRTAGGAYSSSWVNTPADDPPAGYDGRVVGSGRPDRGYEWWFALECESILRPAHVVDEGEGLEWVSLESRAALEAALNAQATRIVVDHGNWDLANTNSDDTPYNGRNIGAIIGANKYTVPGDPAVYLDSVTRTTQAYVFPIDDKPLDEFV